MTDGRTILDGPMESATLIRWAEDIEHRYPDARANEKDRGPALLLAGAYDHGVGAIDSPYAVCVQEQELIGYVGYQALEKFEMLSILSLGVATRFQRRGIGTALLAHLQDKARDRGFFLMASGLLDPGVRCVLRAGFRLAGTWRSQNVFKWSCCPAHQNDDFPGKDTPDLSR